MSFNSSLQNLEVFGNSVETKVIEERERKSFCKREEKLVKQIGRKMSHWISKCSGDQWTSCGHPGHCFTFCRRISQAGEIKATLFISLFKILYCQIWFLFRKSKIFCFYVNSESFYFWMAHMILWEKNHVFLFYYFTRLR